MRFVRPSDESRFVPLVKKPNFDKSGSTQIAKLLVEHCFDLDEREGDVLAREGKVLFAH